MKGILDMRERTQLFGTNGIRGIVNRELTPEFSTEIALSIGSCFHRGRILLGYDGRISNTMLANAVSAGLVSTGCDVYDAGMAPTPCIQLAVRSHKMDGAIMITASHNPPEYNGIKVMARDGVEISRHIEKMIEDRFRKGAMNRVDWREIGQRHSLLGVLDEYKDAVKSQVDADLIKEKHYHVVLDPACGVGGLATPHLLRELGCQVTTINSFVDGSFPARQPEPRPENLANLVATVMANGADFGVAFDGDADRSIFVDEKGNVQWGDRTFALIEKHFLLANPGGKVVTPVSSSQVVRDVADKYGGELVWTKVGSTVVSHTMKKLRAKLGGEENGGVFYGPHQPVRDAAMTTALILNIMGTTERGLAELLDSLPRYYLEKDKVKCPHNQKTSLLKKLLSELDHLNPETIDGVKLWFSDKSSILIRPSGTEPLYRLFAEAITKERASTLVKEYRQKLVQFTRN
jgi:phosphomannomutase/phosphoglucomutase